MKKIICSIILLFLFASVGCAEESQYKVIKVIDGDTVYVDFNKNGIPEREEKVRINGIDTFETRVSDGLKWQMNEYALTQDEAIGLGYYGKEFAKKELLNKYVIAEYTANSKLDKNDRKLMSVYYDCKNGHCKSYEQEVLKAGLAVVYKKSNIAKSLKKFEDIDKIKAYANKSHRLNLVLLNKNTKKYHKITCPHSQNLSEAELIQKPLIRFHKANCCYSNDFQSKHAVFKNDVIEIYFLDPTDIKKSLYALKCLINLIKQSQERIHFAVYGISNKNVMKALIDKAASGVDVKWVTDVNKYGSNNYEGTSDLFKELPKYRTDKMEDNLKFNKKQEVEFYIKKQKIDINFEDEEIEYFTDQLMHNKFFIFDFDTVSTGSVNISNTGLCSKYINANDFIVIKSPEINRIYNEEFMQMYNGNFHRDKKYIPNKKNIKLDNNTVISIYFAPKDSSFMKDIIKIINSSNKYIYVPMFYLTDKNISQSLINAKERGVDVKIILDAVSAKSKYSKHKILRIAGIPLKIENWAGKMHMKCLITEKYVITGSLNWTNRAQHFNDENSLIIENSEIAKIYKKHFLKLYNSIPDKWLYEDPKPEGADSPCSCIDGIDNDHDGYTDMEDYDCNPNAKQGKLYNKYYQNLK